MITVEKVDTSGLNAKLAKLVGITGEVAGKAVRQETRLVGVQLARYTQPFNFSLASRQSGEGTIVRDIRRAFYILPDRLCQNPKTIQTGQYAGWLRLFARRDGAVFIVRPENFLANATPDVVHARHQALRNRNGVVPRGRGNVDKQADYAAIQTCVITQSQFNVELKREKRRVGFAKGGWATGMLGIGGLAGLPDWVKRHAGAAPGSATDLSHQATPTVTLRNSVPYIDKAISGSNIQSALRDAEIRLQKRIDFELKDQLHSKI